MTMVVVVVEVVAIDDDFVVRIKFVVVLMGY